VPRDGEGLAAVKGSACFFLPALALYFIVLPRFYGFSTLGQPLQIFALASMLARRPPTSVANTIDDQAARNSERASLPNHSARP
jgi:hypothetical protein